MSPSRPTTASSPPLASNPQIITCPANSSQIQVTTFTRYVYPYDLCASVDRALGRMQFSTTSNAGTTFLVELQDLSFTHEVSCKISISVSLGPARHSKHIGMTTKPLGSVGVGACIDEAIEMLTKNAVRLLSPQPGGAPVPQPAPTPSPQPVP